MAPALTAHDVQATEPRRRESTAPAGDGPVRPTIVVVCRNPARSPKGTARGADQRAAWLGWLDALDEEPTWEDAEWR